MARLEERDLRSLDRRSMYSIFAPLDPNERLPRELLLEGRRFKSISGRQFLAPLWPLAFVIIVAIAGQMTDNVLIVLGILALAFAAFWTITSTGKHV